MDGHGESEAAGERRDNTDGDLGEGLSRTGCQELKLSRLAVKRTERTCSC